MEKNNDIRKNYDQMYEFENNKQLYNFCFKDTQLPMWMYIRFFVIESVTYKKVYEANEQIYRGKKSQKQIKKSILQKYITKNPFLSTRKEIIFAFWEYQDLKPHADGRIYEDFIMPFLQACPQNTATLMSGNILNQYELRCTHPNWKMDDIFNDILKLIKNEVSTEDLRQIRGIIDFLESNCPFHVGSQLKKDIFIRLCYFARYSKNMIRICELYLRIVRPKIMVMFCASYPGIFRTSMVIACKNKNVPVVELQHGWIGEYHSNYHHCNYIIKSKKCNHMLADYFLTFGKYWNNQIKLFSKCNVIGYTKPVIEAAVPENNKILFCAGLHFETYMTFLDELMPKLDDDTIIYFRFHPTSSSQIQKNLFKKYLKYSNFLSADEKDLSDYMKECRYVIVDGSTIAYEALFMGRIVFALESELSIKLGYRDLPDVHLFQDASGFMALWNKRNNLKSVYHKEFFDLNYQENYIRFLKKCGVDVSGKKNKNRGYIINEKQ